MTLLSLHDTVLSIEIEQSKANREITQIKRVSLALWLSNHASIAVRLHSSLHGQIENYISYIYIHVYIDFITIGYEPDHTNPPSPPQLSTTSSVL